jgi:hypothetical protein
MKPHAVSLFFLVGLASSIQAWTLTVTQSNGRKITSHGTFNSGCVNYGDLMTTTVNRIDFEGSAFVDTVEIWSQLGCSGDLIVAWSSPAHGSIPTQSVWSYRAY